MVTTCLVFIFIKHLMQLFVNKLPMNTHCQEAKIGRSLVVTTVMSFWNVTDISLEEPFVWIII